MDERNRPAALGCIGNDQSSYRGGRSDLTRKLEKVGPFECAELEKHCRVGAKCYPTRVPALYTMTKEKFKSVFLLLRLVSRQTNFLGLTSPKLLGLAKTSWVQLGQKERAWSEASPRNKEDEKLLERKCTKLGSEFDDKGLRTATAHCMSETSPCAPSPEPHPPSRPPLNAPSPYFHPWPLRLQRVSSEYP